MVDRLLLDASTRRYYERVGSISDGVKWSTADEGKGTEVKIATSKDFAASPVHIEISTDRVSSTGSHASNHARRVKSVVKGGKGGKVGRKSCLSK